VGQTKKRLATRIKEHKNDIKKTSGNLSVVLEHRLIEGMIFIGVICLS